MVSQHLVVLSPSAAFYVQQGNSGFSETGFCEQEQREPNVKGVTVVTCPGGKCGTSWALSQQQEKGRLL